MNTASNSRPLAECTVISCSASWPSAGLVLARLERGVRQEGGERRHHLAGSALSSVAGLILHESRRGVDQFLQVLERSAPSRSFL